MVTAPSLGDLDESGDIADAHQNGDTNASLRHSSVETENTTNPRLSAEIERSPSSTSPLSSTLSSPDGVLSASLDSKRAQRIRAFIAGAIAGVAIFIEERPRRVLFAQQFTVRGLQGMYNFLKLRQICHFPFGDALLFILCNAQIL